MKQFNNLIKIKELLSLLIKHCVKDQREKQFRSPTSPRKAQRDVFIRSNQSRTFTEMNKNLKEMNTKTNNRQATVKRQLIPTKLDVTYTA